MKYIIRGFLFFTLCVGFIACDDLDLENDDAGDVRGLWEKYPGDGSNEFVFISDTRFGFYQYNAGSGCMTTELYRVVQRDGTGFFQVSKDDGSPLKVFAVSLNAERIHLRDIDDTQRQIQRYWASTKTDIDEFAPVCYNPELTGTWVLTNNEIEEYISVSKQKFEVASFDTLHTCFNNVKFNVIGIDMPEMIIQNQANTSEEFTFNITVSDSLLSISRTVTGSVFESNYTASDTLISQLSPFCSNTSPTSLSN